jgi:hypothetical protein
MCNAVKENGVKARVKDNDLEAGSRGRITL